MSAVGSRTVAALALQLAALLALGLALQGASWLDARLRARLLVLVDRSQSVPRAESDLALAHIAQAAEGIGMSLQLIEFAGRPGAPTPQAGSLVAHLDPAATNVEVALEAALAIHAEAALDGLVVVSDGQENAGDASRALRSAREAGLPVLWYPVGRPPPSARVSEVLAPDRGWVGQRMDVTVELAGALDRPLRVKAIARSPHGDAQAVTREVVNEARTTLQLDARQAGVLLIDVVLEDPAAGQVLDTLHDAAAIDIAPRAAILYAQGSAGPLAASLVQGGWNLNVVAARRLDSQIDGLAGYRAVVLDDVAVADASPRFWRALITAVEERGLGLMVLGGERSFARGGYRDSTLESVLPVLSEPAALDQPVSVLFAVDKSGSMGQGSGGVDRFQMAQRAVLETARGLGPRDSLGLMVFDVTPRVLVPLGPAKDAMQVLERPWPAGPNGGTRVGPALEAAIDALGRSGKGRRLLVLVTDGFIDNVPLVQWRSQLAKERIEAIALAVGPDADAAALDQLVGADAGMVLRVDQAAELPIAMRSGLERRRGRVEHGAIAVEQVQPLPFAPATVNDWPAIAAYAVTRSRPDASVAVQSRRGEPLIAFRRSGNGRVVAVTSGMGHWTPRWVTWNAWPRLAAGLATWISDTSRGNVESIVVSERPSGLQVDALVATASGHADPGGLSIEVSTPAERGRRLAMDHVAPGRWRAELSDAGAGLYTFLVSTPIGTQRHLHLRRQRTENASWGVSPAVASWRAAGLVSDWSPGSMGQQALADRGGRPLDRSLVGLALALFVAGVLVDRPPKWLAGLGAAIRRLQQRG